MNKPDKQTIVPLAFVPSIMTTLPLSRLKGFGGKLGHQLKTEFGVLLAGELSQLSESALSAKFEPNQCKWMLLAAKGEFDEPLTPRTLPENVTCGKTFRGATGLSLSEFFSPTATPLPSDSASPAMVLKWIKELSEELIDRLNSLATVHSRIAKQVSVSFSIEQPGNSSFAPMRLSKSITLPPKYDAGSLSLTAYHHIKQCLSRSSLPPAALPTCRITALFLTGNSFETRASGEQAINHYFSASKLNSGPISRPPAAALPSPVTLPPSAMGQQDPQLLLEESLPPDVDPEVFRSLPKSLQDELRRSFRRQSIPAEASPDCVRDKRLLR
jgi:DNA polymerase eta